MPVANPDEKTPIFDDVIGANRELLGELWTP